MEVNMDKVVITILQGTGSVGGLTIYFPVTNFL